MNKREEAQLTLISDLLVLFAWIAFDVAAYLRWGLTTLLFAIASELLFAGWCYHRKIERDRETPE